MVGFLPRIYPNELLYSFVARYHKHTLNQSPKYTSEELFRHSMQLAVPDLPLNLGTISNNMNTFMKAPVDKIINDHTFFNFYTNFISLDKRSFVRNTMTTGDNKCAIHMTTGIMASEVKEKQFFNHCTECIKEDIKEFGETYWHLHHQLPGVFVCLEHNTLIKKSCIPFRPKERNLFYPASEEDLLTPCLEISDKKTFNKLQAIAKHCKILAAKHYSFNLEELQEKYKLLLKKNGFTLRKGAMVDQKELVKQFQLFYGDEVLNILQSSVCYEDSACWLKAITRKHRKSFHPIRHILFILFMGETLETIDKVSGINSNPLGEGLFPCLNKAASHYRKLTIPEVEITICSKTKRIIGTFRCECGFHYTRNDQDTENIYKISRIKQFGDLWIKTVVDLIQNKKMSYRSVAKQLNVDTKTIIKYANFKKENRYEANSKTDETIEKKKSEWLSLIKETPKKSVTELRLMNPALYAFLYRNDKQWLKENSPKKGREKNPVKVDWDKRDLLLKEEIEKAVKNIISYEPSVRVTISRIGTEIGKRSLLQKHLHKLPESCAAINNYVEDTATFQKRRIKYCIEDLMKNGEEIKEWRLRRSAGLKTPIDEDLITTLIKQIDVDKKTLFLVN